MDAPTTWESHGEDVYAYARRIVKAENILPMSSIPPLTSCALLAGKAGARSDMGDMGEVFFG